MKKSVRQCIFLLLCICFSLSLQARQQELLPDSVMLSQSNKDLCQLRPDHTHDFKIRKAIIPIALTGLTTAFVYDNWFGDRKIQVQQALSPQSGHKLKFDDYLQYALMVAAYGISLSKAKGQHRLLDKTIILAMSYATMGILVNGMKYTFKEQRPDSGSRNSFPSGHTATAFMGATFLYKEFKDVSPWIGYGGFAVAALTGYLRIYNNRHYINDVIAGACIGILSTRIAYWVYPKIFRKTSCRQAQDRNSLMVYGLPYYSAQGMGVNLCMTF